MSGGIPIVFWVSLVGLAYIFAGYPLLIAVMGRLHPLRCRREFQPRTVSVVLAVHNEAHNLSRKLASLLAMEQQSCLVEVLIGSDGSTDNTAELLQSSPDPRVRLILFPERRGKPAVLNDLIPQCQGEIVLLTDARQEFDRNLLAALLADFADDRVGVVSGELVLRRSAAHTTAAEGIGLYWRYEKFLRKSESGFRGVPGATGACYAIRKSGFRPIADSTILDDVAIPMTLVAQGYRCLFEPAAIAYDDPTQSPQQEVVRKRRTIAGAAQLVRLYPQWLWPGNNPLWFEFVSHKLLRLVAPALLLTLLVSNLWLSGSGPYRVLLSLQFSFYVTAACGWWLQRSGQRSVLFGPSLMFVTLNLTTIAALWDAWRSRYRVTWTKAGTPT